MQLVVVISALIFTANAASYGMQSSGSRSGYGSGRTSSGLNGMSYSSGANGYGGNSGAGQVIQAAVQTRHQIEFYDVPSTGSVNPITVEVSSN